MVLQVSFEDFADTVRRVVGDSAEAYVSPEHGSTLLTASASSEGTVVAAVTTMPVDAVKAELQKQGLRVFNGRWTDDLVLEKVSGSLEDVTVAGVAYKTEGGPPGIWIDAYPSTPTQVQVLKAMYDEMIHSGEMADVSFEEFVRLSDANVVIVPASELRSFLTSKSSKEEA